ncbi:MAG TPA: hypothetical protein VLI71_08870 [Gammaproteobacteria bacterium]|nr:hypothetical protein [Gammaproteobacteria bacterium]
MNVRALAGLAFVTLAAALAAALAAQTSSSTPKLPRTSWGDPRIEGTYTNKDEFGTPFERPAEFEGKQRREFGPEQMAELMVERTRRAQAGAARIGGSATNDTGAGPPHWYEHLDASNSRPWLVSEPADGKVPAVTDAARQRAQSRSLPKREAPDTYTDMSLYDRCISIGLPGSMMPMIYGNAYRITQSPGYVAIQYEMVHEARIIPLGDSPHIASSLDFYMGDARGRWEGDTLVVETRNIRPEAAYRNASENLVVTERFTPIDENTLSWEVRFEDPETWTAPWTIEMPLKRDAEAAPFEYACHEGNLGLRNILSAARATDDERAAN